VHSPDGAACANCGQPRGGYQYCVNCGHDLSLDVAQERSATAETIATMVRSATKEQTPHLRPLTLSAAQLAEPATASGTTATTPAGGGSSSLSAGSAPGRSRRRTSLAVALLAAALAVAFVVTRGADRGQAGSSGDSDPAAIPTRSSSPSSTPSPTPSSPSSSPSEPSSSISSASGWACWNGTQTATRAECPAPSGVDGLAWVFPSLDLDQCDEGAAGAWSCRVTDSATVTYRGLPSVRRGIARYAQIVPGDLLPANQSGNDRFLWCATRPDAQGDWLIAVMYADEPWAVEVKATSLAKAKKALGTVEFRDAAQLRALSSDA
jgi:hypothetical protein